MPIAAKWLNVLPSERAANAVQLSQNAILVAAGEACVRLRSSRKT